MRLRISSCFLIVVLSLSPRLLAQTEPAPTEKTAVSDEAIVLDLVVRDKKGNPVTDLRADEVEIYEDGAKQTLMAFRRVTMAASAPDTAPLADDASASQSRVIFLIPRLSAHERDLAKRAAEQFIKKQFVAGMTGAVLLVGDELEPVQDYTTDRALLKDAVKRALGESERLPPPAIQSLLSLVQTLKDQPGRKTVLLFSAGVGVPEGFEYLVEALPAAANRYRVSFYGVDPRGHEMAGAMDVTGGTGDQELVGWMHGYMEEYRGGSLRGREDVRWRDPHAGRRGGGAEAALRAIAQATGGRMMDRTNSFSKPMLRIAEDARGYYELRYTPTADKAKGAIRNIEVKVARRDAEVQARPYYLVGDAMEPPVPEFEEQLSAALAASTLPRDVEAWERVFHFAWNGKELEHILWVRVPLAKVTLAEDKEAGQFKGRVSILARVKDVSNKVVASFSKDYSLTPPSDQLERARSLSINFTRRLKLIPGEYVLETAVRDVGADKLTARRVKFNVEAPQNLVLSSLMLGNFVPAGPDSSPNDPFRKENERLMPNVNAPIKAGQSAMVLYYVVFLPADSREPARATFSLYTGMRVLMNTTAPLPEPDANGRIPYGSMLRVDLLPAGSYKLKVVVTQGTNRTEESLEFEIVS